jgi:D-beta-D-heptose 7-phosphate kinase / D-beta-D-heptose 1-phosphate adenosyltransferase
MNTNNNLKLLSKIKEKHTKFLVLGDVMLDNYITGIVRRISPEAPVPILDFQDNKDVLGGAGNVAHNLVNFGADVTLATLIGQDNSGNKIVTLLDDVGVSTEFIQRIAHVKTTKKSRFLSEGTQLLRLDADSKGLLSDDYTALSDKINKNINSFDCLIISDYDKGVCSPHFIQSIMKKARMKNIPIYIDPKGSNWDRYINGTCLTPNTKEVEIQLNVELKTDLDFEKAAKILKHRFKLDFCLITRGSDGMTYFDGIHLIHQKVSKKEVFDVSGAGDTVIACLASSFMSGLKLSDSIKLSSLAASSVVTHVGTTPFNINFLKDIK